MVRRRLDAGPPAQTEAMRLSSPSRSKQSRRAAVMKLAVVSGLVGSGLAAMAGNAGADTVSGGLVLMSASVGGEPANGSSSYGVSTSADGRYVAFASMATNLVPGDQDMVVDVFVKDLATGNVELVSQTADGLKGNAISERPSMSADGSAVAFASKATNLSSDTPDGRSHFYVKNLDSGLLTVADGGTIDRPDQQFGAN